MRKSRIDYYMNMARMVAERSTCSRGKVGAVLTNHGRVVGTGYNGGPHGTTHCVELPLPIPVLLSKHQLTPEELVEYNTPGAIIFMEEPNPITQGCSCITDEQGRCALSIHAEVNAILSREGQSQPTDELVMYCTHQPCRHCLRIMKQYGVKIIYYGKPYPDDVRDKIWRHWNSQPEMNHVIQS